MTENKWDLRFLELAKLISTWSKDPSTKVGSVITNNKNEVISLGYNGFPKNIKDDERILDRQQKLDIILHAEDNALLFAKTDLTNTTIYTYPILPCSRCATKIIQTGISKVVSFDHFPARWEDNLRLSISLFKEAGIELILLK